jgi:hypothetical protein
MKSDTKSLHKPLAAIKLFLVFLIAGTCLASAAACAKSESEPAAANDSESTAPIEKEKSEAEKLAELKESDPKLYWQKVGEQLLSGDYSAVAGVYVNESEKSDPLTLYIDGSYSWLGSIYYSPGTGTFAAQLKEDGSYWWSNWDAAFILFPVGVDVHSANGVILNTDTSRIRVMIGQSLPSDDSGLLYLDEPQKAESLPPEPSKDWNKVYAPVLEQYCELATQRYSYSFEDYDNVTIPGSIGGPPASWINLYNTMHDNMDSVGLYIDPKDASLDNYGYTFHDLDDNGVPELLILVRNKDNTLVCTAFSAGRCYYAPNNSDFQTGYVLHQLEDYNLGAGYLTADNMLRINVVIYDYDCYVLEKLESGNREPTTVYMLSSQLDDRTDEMLYYMWCDPELGNSVSGSGFTSGFNSSDPYGERIKAAEKQAKKISKSKYEEALAQFEKDYPVGSTTKNLNFIPIGGFKR